MNEKKLRNKLAELIKPHLNKLFFPEGIYGGTAYYVEEDGFYGPHYIPDWVVPIYFSFETFLKFEQNLKKYNKQLNSINDDDVEKITKGLDLTFGNGWTLDAEQFIDMVKNECEPDTVYLDREFSADDYDDFFESTENGIIENYAFNEWNELDLEDVDYWCNMLSEADETKKNAGQGHLPDRK